MNPLQFDSSRVWTLRGRIQAQEASSVARLAGDRRSAIAEHTAPVAGRKHFVAAHGQASPKLAPASLFAIHQFMEQVSPVAEPVSAPASSVPPAPPAERELSDEEVMLLRYGNAWMPEDEEMFQSIILASNGWLPEHGEAEAVRRVLYANGRWVHPDSQE